MATSGDPRRRRRGITVAAGVACLLLLGVAAVLVVGPGGGCGGEGYPDSPDCVAQAYVTRDDASRCDLVAPALLREITGTEGPEARRRCAAGARAGGRADAVEVLERERIGDTVIVELLVDGREGKLTLGRSGGRWQITSFAE